MDSTCLKANIHFPTDWVLLRDAVRTLMKATMSASPEGTRNSESVRRMLAAVGCVVFLALAIKMGAESFHARSAGAPMSNWKGGTMAYQDGFKVTAVFVAFSACFSYIAARSKVSR